MKWPFPVLEVVVGMLLIIAVCFVLHPADPLLLGFSFPWIWLAALVFALRYGALLGVLASVIIAAAWYVFYALDANINININTVFPAEVFTGGLILVVLAGHFCDVWTQRINKLQQTNHYLDNRLSAITTNHYLLRVSHARLEKDLLSKPTTLVDALSYLRELCLTNLTASPLPNIQEVLEFVSQSCHIDTAAVFTYEQSVLSTSGVAWLGERFDLNPHDPLVRECIERKALVHLQQLDTQQSAYLACVPIVTASGVLKGVLVIRNMSFLSLNHDNLQLLLISLNYYADGIEHAEAVRPIQRVVPSCPYDFAVELNRLAHMQAAVGIESSLIAFVFKDTSARSLFDTVTSLHHSHNHNHNLDMLWSFTTEDKRVAVILLPLSNPHDVDAWLLQVEDTIKKQFDTNLAQEQVAVHRCAVDAKMPGQGLKTLLDRCDL